MIQNWEQCPLTPKSSHDWENCHFIIFQKESKYRLKLCFAYFTWSQYGPNSNEYYSSSIAYVKLKYSIELCV